jgi:hypothetical protein
MEEKLEESVLRDQAMISYEEILKRFKKLFGREMTAAEPRSFFLPHEITPPAEKTRLARKGPTRL